MFYLWLTAIFGLFENLSFCIKESGKIFMQIKGHYYNFLWGLIKRLNFLQGQFIHHNSSFSHHTQVAGTLTTIKQTITYTHLDHLGTTFVIVRGACWSPLPQQCVPNRATTSNLSSGPGKYCHVQWTTTNKNMPARTVCHDVTCEKYIQNTTKDNDKFILWLNFYSEYI